MSNQKTKLELFIVSRRWNRINTLASEARSVDTTSATIGKANGGRRIEAAKRK
jgi:hypothetical protein